MTPLLRQTLLKCFKILDLLILLFSFAVATWASNYPMGVISFKEFLAMRVKVQNVSIFLLFLLLWQIIFSAFGLYHSRRFSTRRDEIIDVLKATLLGTLVVLVSGILFNIKMVTPAFLVAFWGVSSASAISARLIIRYLLERTRIRGRNLIHALIVGTNSRAIRFARKIQSKPELGYQLIGFVDDEWTATGEIQKKGYTLVASLNNFSTFLRDHVVDEVVVCLPMKSFYHQASHIVALCEEQGIIIRFLSSIFNPKLARFKPEQFDEDSVITLYSGTMDGWGALAKRALDFSLSLVCLLLLVPLFLVITFLIKISSPGPVFFIQERVGLNKRRFRLYKFRTMVPDAERKLAEIEHLNEVSGPVFKIKNDPRVTAIGKFLRKTSLDELPQLINVLKGDMSLVGPRPLPVRDYNGFDQDCLRRRFSVRPGITCLWQINGRSSVPFMKWMELDMQYIDQWSLWLDLKILAKTIPAVFRGSGAA